MIYALILYACSSQACDQHILAEGLTQTQCKGIGWQATVAEFFAQHPKLKFDHVECVPIARLNEREA